MFTSIYYTAPVRRRSEPSCEHAEVMERSHTFTVCSLLYIVQPLSEDEVNLVVNTRKLWSVHLHSLRLFISIYYTAPVRRRSEPSCEHAEVMERSLTFTEPADPGNDSHFGDIDLSAAAAGSEEGVLAAVRSVCSYGDNDNKVKSLRLCLCLVVRLSVRLCTAGPEEGVLAAVRSVCPHGDHDYKVKSICVI